MTDGQWKMVPVEPTEEMVAEGAKRIRPDWPQSLVDAPEVYRTMLAAAPQPPVGYAGALEMLSQRIAELRHMQRWNIERDGDDLLICDGEHEKAEGCKYERWVRAATLSAAPQPATQDPKNGGRS